MIEDRKHFFEQLQSLGPPPPDGGPPAAPEPPADPGRARGAESFYLIDGRYELWPERLQARVERQWVDLTPTELRILILLVERPNRVWRREQLVRACHRGYSTVSDRSVDFIVHNLRRKLGAMGHRIRTARGRGFYFEASDVRHERRCLSLGPWLLLPLVRWASDWLRGWRAELRASLLVAGGVAAAGAVAATIFFTPIRHLVAPPKVEMLGISELASDTPEAVADPGPLDVARSVGGLSGIGYDGGDTLVVVSDVNLLGGKNTDPTRTHRFRFSVDSSARRFTIGVEQTASLRGADGNPFLCEPVANPLAEPSARQINPEGACVDDSTTWVADEYGGRVMQFDREFRLLRDIKLPPAFGTRFGPSAASAFDATAGVLPFRGLSGVARTPKRHRLIMATAAPLAQDGGALGTHIRFVRVDPDSGEMVQFAYHLDIPYNVIHDLYALDEHRLLVLESDSGRVEGFRYCRLHLVNLDRATDVSPLEQVRERFLPEWVRPATKQMVLDLEVWISEQGLDIATMSVQGITLGPRLPDGRRLLVIVTDNQYDRSTPTYFLWAVTTL